MTTAFIANHLWQSSCFVLLAGFSALVLRKHSARIRYWVWLSASLKFLVPFASLVNLGNVFRGPGSHPLSVGAPGFPHTLAEIAQPFSTVSITIMPERTPFDWAPIAAGVWMLGFSAIIVARCRSWLVVRAALRSSTPIKLPIPVRSLIVPGVKEPGIVGILRPALILPAELLKHLNPRQLSAILTHEMCHVRRKDNFLAAVHMSVEAIFWFHPLVWWIGSRLLEERELACDEEVLRTGCEPQDYVQGILKVCRFYTESQLPCVSGVTGADIKKRIRGILAGGIPRELSAGHQVTLAMIGVAVVTVPILIGVLNGPEIGAQSARATRPTFDSASVKSTGVRREAWMRPMPGRLTARARLRELTQAAYQMQDFQVVGGPEWVRTEVYEIDAKAPTNAPVPHMLLMLQSLLEDRFQLRTHRESRVMPMYALTPVNGGFRPPPPQDGNCTTDKPAPPGRGEPAPKAMCGDLEARLEAGGWHMVGGQVPMAMFVHRLTEVLGRTVVDQTGFSGLFDIDLVFRRDDTTDIARRMGMVPPGGGLPGNTSISTIFSAVQHLGLQLELTEGPVEMLIIDRVEQPSVN